MSYLITDYSKRQAEKLGVKLEPSKKKNKKIDVILKDGKKISIGDIRYKDFPTYIKEKGLEYAKERRRLYHIRHAKTKNIKGTASYYASRILW